MARATRPCLPPLTQPSRSRPASGACWGGPEPGPGAPDRGFLGRDAHDLVFADVDYDRAGTRPELPDAILPVDEVFHVDHARAEAVLEQMRNTVTQPGGLLGKLQSGLRRTMRKAF